MSSNWSSKRGDIHLKGNPVRVPLAKSVSLVLTLLPSLLLGQSPPNAISQEHRPRAREIGLRVGILAPGRLNAITDVPGVRVGQATLIRGDTIRTGVTAILPHSGNLFRDKVPAAIHVGNGFGKLMGSTQVSELGEIETPILLTSTLNVPRVADALIEYMLALPGNEDVRSINPVVAETNDGLLNDIRSRPVGREEVFQAIRRAGQGPVEEGSVGAGTGTVAFGFKGGIGTSSRVLLESRGGYTIGVLVQTNFGGVLTINGAPVGRSLHRFLMQEDVDQKPAGGSAESDRGDGSIIIVVATDAPVDARNLRRLAARAMLGLGRTGSPSTNGSGDYVIAFSTAQELRIRSVQSSSRAALRILSNEEMTPLFQAVVEATEEAIYNSLFRATTIRGMGGRVIEALPLGQTIEILKKHRALSE